MTRHDASIPNIDEIQKTLILVGLERNAPKTLDSMHTHNLGQSKITPEIIASLSPQTIKDYPFTIVIYLLIFKKEDLISDELLINSLISMARPTLIELLKNGSFLKRMTPRVLLSLYTNVPYEFLAFLLDSDIKKFETNLDFLVTKKLVAHSILKNFFYTLLLLLESESKYLTPELVLVAKENLPEEEYDDGIHHILNHIDKRHRPRVLEILRQVEKLEYYNSMQDKY